MTGNFGFIHEKIEIKILILFIMRRISEPIDFEVLTKLTMCDDGIGYFDYMECVAELVKTGHLRLDDGKYSITAKGIHNGDVTENSLPFTVRMNAENEVSKLRVVHDRNSMIKTSHKMGADGGCIVDLALSDGIGEIVKMELFAYDAEQALALEKGFRKNAESIYNALIEMILD